MRGSVVVVCGNVKWNNVKYVICDLWLSTFWQCFKETKKMISWWALGERSLLLNLSVFVSVLRNFKWIWFLLQNITVQSLRHCSGLENHRRTATPRWRILPPNSQREDIMQKVRMSRDKRSDSPVGRVHRPQPNWVSSLRRQSRHISCKRQAQLRFPFTPYCYENMFISWLKYW